MEDRDKLDGFNKIGRQSSPVHNCDIVSDSRCTKKINHLVIFMKSLVLTKLSELDSSDIDRRPSHNHKVGLTYQDLKDVAYSTDCIKTQQRVFALMLGRPNPAIEEWRQRYEERKRLKKMGILLPEE